MLFLSAAEGAAGAGIPAGMRERVARWIDTPSETLSIGGPRILRPGAIVLRAPIRAMNAMILSHPIEFGGHRLREGTRFYRVNSDSSRSGPPYYCTFPQSADRDLQLQQLLGALAPNLPPDQSGTQTICLSSERHGIFNLLTVTAVMQRGRFLLPNRTFQIRVASAILRHEPDRTQVTGRIEVSYQVARRGRPEFRLSMTDFGARAEFDSITIPTLLGDFTLTPSIPIDTTALPMWLHLGNGQLTVTAFDRESGNLTATVEREPGFTADRHFPTALLFHFQD